MRDPKVTISPGAQQDATLTLTIPGGDAGTDATIEAMRAMAIHGSNAPKIVELASRFGGEDLANSERLKSMYAWFRAHMVFNADPAGIERVQTPELMLAKVHASADGIARGDCDCLATIVVATMLAMKLRAMLPAFVVVGKAKFPAEFRHVFSALYLSTQRNPTKLPHWGEDRVPSGFLPIDPQEVENIGAMKAAARIRVYPVLP